YLAKVCAHLTSEDHDEILGRYKNHLLSIISSTSSLKRAKDKAHRLNDTAKRSFQRIEVTSFFKRLDTQVDTNATDSLAHATENLVNAKENLYESKLKARAYDGFVENTDVKNDRSSKRLRQETIISEEDKKQYLLLFFLSDANTVSKADDDNFDVLAEQQMREQFIRGLNPMNQYNVRMMAKYHDTRDNITKALVEAEKFSLLQGNFPFPPFGDSVPNSYE
ncbi:12141_t:CDS:2, partial [Ambispora leptoticha]